jgi:hypothetical protein
LHHDIIHGTLHQVEKRGGGRRQVDPELRGCGSDGRDRLFRRAHSEVLVHPCGFRGGGGGVAAAHRAVPRRERCYFELKVTFAATISSVEIVWENLGVVLGGHPQSTKIILATLRCMGLMQVKIVGNVGGLRGGLR